MGAIEEYCGTVTGILRKIVENEQERIAKAVSILADVFEKDRLIYILGTGGHSTMGAEEMFWRAGEIVPVSAAVRLIFTAADLANTMRGGDPASRR